MRIAAKTDIGHQRSENQDSYRAGRQSDDTVWAAVCDGMGGAKGGKVASTIASATLEEWFIEHIDDTRTAEDVRECMVEGIRLANSAIYATSMDNADLSGMGTTVVCVVVRGDEMQVAHVGDSRVYLLRDGVMRLLTRDHSIVQQLLEDGSITEQEAFNHPKRNILTRVLGVDDDVLVDWMRVPVREGDIALLCSDGLSTYVPDAEIEHVLNTTSFYEMPDALIEKALDAGGVDNVTVLLVKKQETEEENG